MKKTCMSLLAMSVALSCASSASALADQCSYVKKGQAEAAVALLKASQKIGGSVVTLCQPCNEHEPQKQSLKKASIRPTGDADFPSEVVINGKTGIDLAYTFVQTGPTVWTNLAHLTGCPLLLPHSVSLFITEEKPGELSVGDYY